MSEDVQELKDRIKLAQDVIENLGCGHCDTCIHDECGYFVVDAILSGEKYAVCVDCDEKTIVNEAGVCALCAETRENKEDDDDAEEDLKGKDFDVFPDALEDCYPPK